jgi:hypothetical protein
MKYEVTSQIGDLFKDNWAKKILDFLWILVGAIHELPLL